MSERRAARFKGHGRDSDEPGEVEDLLTPAKDQEAELPDGWEDLTAGSPGDGWDDLGPEGERPDGERA